MCKISAEILRQSDGDGVSGTFDGLRTRTENDLRDCCQKEKKNKPGPGVGSTGSMQHRVCRESGSDVPAR